MTKFQDKIIFQKTFQIYIKQKCLGRYGLIFFKNIKFHLYHRKNGDDICTIKIQEMDLKNSLDKNYWLAKLIYFLRKLLKLESQFSSYEVNKAESIKYLMPIQFETISLNLLSDQKEIEQTINCIEKCVVDQSSIYEESDVLEQIDLDLPTESGNKICQEIDKNETQDNQNSATQQNCKQYREMVESCQFQNLQNLQLVLCTQVFNKNLRFKLIEIFKSRNLKLRITFVDNMQLETSVTQYFMPGNFQVEYFASLCFIRYQPKIVKNKGTEKYEINVENITQICNRMAISDIFTIKIGPAKKKNDEVTELQLQFCLKIIFKKEKDCRYQYFKLNITDKI